VHESEVIVLIGRCERMVLGTLQLYAKEFQHQLTEIRGQMEEVFQRLTTAENEIAAAHNREGQYVKKS